MTPTTADAYEAKSREHLEFILRHALKNGSNPKSLTIWVEDYTLRGFKVAATLGCSHSSTRVRDETLHRIAVENGFQHEEEFVWYADYYGLTRVVTQK